MSEMNQTLQKLIKICWSDFKKLEKEHPDLVVQNSIPILWFGDIDAYFESKKRILTVAINPSNLEFMEKNGQRASVKLRFPAASKIADEETLDDADCEIYKKAMCEYFSQNKVSWFDNYERILKKLNASYECILGNEVNTAIHIDIHTPVATREKWSSVCKKGQDEIVKTANTIKFESLFNFLNPDVTLVSYHRDEVKKFPNIPNLTVWSKKCGEYKGKHSNAFVSLYRLTNGKALISGLNMNGDPFGGYNEFYDKAFAEMMNSNNIFDL